VVALILLALIFVLSALLNAPLQERANPAFSPNPAKAPWYFMGIQELLLHFHPLFSVLIIPVAFLGFLVWIPFIKYSGSFSGRWFFSEKGRKITLISSVSAAVLSSIFIVINDRLLDFEGWMISLPEVISNGLIPFVILLVVAWIYFLLIRKKFKPNREELLISIISSIFSAYIVLTIFGIFFRGEGMGLVWP